MCEIVARRFKTRKRPYAGPRQCKKCLYWFVPPAAGVHVCICCCVDVRRLPPPAPVPPPAPAVRFYPAASAKPSRPARPPRYKVPDEDVPFCGPLVLNRCEVCTAERESPVKYTRCPICEVQKFSLVSCEECGAPFWRASGVRKKSRCYAKCLKCRGRVGAYHKDAVYRDPKRGTDPASRLSHRWRNRPLFEEHSIDNIAKVYESAGGEFNFH